MGGLFKPSKVLIDTNVWLGFFLGHDPCCRDVKAMLDSCCRHGVELFYAPAALKDLFYLLPRSMRRELVEEQGLDAGTGGVSFKPAAQAAVRFVMDLASAAPQTSAECELGWMLRNTHDDFEDNLMMATAETCGADYVVTYDGKLTSHFSPVCLRPEELSSLLGVLNVEGTR